MDNGTQFDWPGPPYFLSDDPPELLDAMAVEPPDDRDPRVPAVRSEPGLTDDTIARLEADRRVARVLIQELEHTCAVLEKRVTAQRRRLLLLERQLEDAGVEPARDWQRSRASWLDRLFGVSSSAQSA